MHTIRKAVLLLILSGRAGVLGGSRVVLGLCWGILGGFWANKFILPESGQAWQNAFRGFSAGFPQNTWAG